VAGELLFRLLQGIQFNLHKRLTTIA